ncbi:hypothetical protein HS041_27340 [Planomonospora sp. ID67723]|uniref:hypothetical protein n=1 Tax=Planomonospora sp. ID67723 TaxID=2738134 RepID=UPI0018C3D5F0|nr:hypothetical protein [Planomonospora sp. ID67723]MBG0831463.1 hypothetical protein [Planomonospora sp. ID67723]
MGFSVRQDAVDGGPPHPARGGHRGGRALVDGDIDATVAPDAGVPLADVQELPGHASPVTTQRCNRGRRKLDSHAAYRMAALLGGS